jgi:hypothetical protein
MLSCESSAAVISSSDGAVQPESGIRTSRQVISHINPKVPPPIICNFNAKDDPKDEKD